MIVGHTHRVSNLMRGNILITEGINAGASYSVLQLMVKRRRRRSGPAGRPASPRTIGVAARADVQAIVDDANAQTAVLRNQVIGTQSNDITRAPTRLHESEMGNIVADAMRAKYPGVDAAYTNSGGLRAEPRLRPAERRRAARRDHLGRGVRRAAVRQPHVDPDPDRRPAPDRRSSTGSRRSATRASRRHRAVPAGLGPQGARSTATGRRPVVDGIWKAPDGVAGTADPDRPDRHRPARHQRLHVHRRRRLHRLRQRHERRAAGRRPARRSRSTTSRPTRRSTRRSKAGSSVRSTRQSRDATGTRAGPPGRLFSFPRSPATALASGRDPRAPGHPRQAARPAGRLPDAGRPRRRPVRRQGPEPAQPRPEYWQKQAPGRARATGSAASSTGSPTSSTR